MWCPKCKTEYREGITECSECGSPLVEKCDGVDVCEINDEKTADEIAEFLTYSGVKDVEKVANTDGSSFRILVPEEEERHAEQVFHGYMLAKEEEKDQEETEEVPENEEDTLLQVDDIEEDTVELLYASDKKEYVKKADAYRDLKFSGITFILFGILGAIYLTLSKTKMIPIQYNMVIFWIIAALFAAFFIGGIVSIIKAGKIKPEIAKEESLTNEIMDWLKETVTEEKMEQWKDPNVSDVENDLLLVAHIGKVLREEYGDLDTNYLEMIADEFYENNFTE